MTGYYANGKCKRHYRRPCNPCSTEATREFAARQLGAAIDSILGALPPDDMWFDLRVELGDIRDAVDTADLDRLVRLKRSVQQLVAFHVGAAGDDWRSRVRQIAEKGVVVHA